MSQTERDQPLRGMCILVADDEIMIALHLEETLRDAGAEIIGASTLAAALRGAEDSSVSAAILDVHLGKQTTETVADILVRRKLPFLFHSGHALPDFMHAKFSTAPLMLKPVRQGGFVKALVKAMKV